MLSRLHIENFAIIDSLDIEFPGGFLVITGETGAGKSIVMDALRLILGARADSASFVPGKKCVVEGHFSLADNTSVNAFLEHHELDQQDELVVRREISTTGKSRSFINDTPVGLQALESLGHLLVDLHQQFDTAELTTRNFQKQVLDGLSGNLAYRKTLREQHQQLQEIQKQIQDLSLQKEKALRESDYDRYLLDELEQFSPKENELENLEAEQKRLSRSDDILSALMYSHRLMQEGEDGLLMKLRQVINKLDTIRDDFPVVAVMTERLRSCMLELKDLEEETERLQGEVSSDEGRLQIVSERLSEGYRLLKKHGVQQTSQLIELIQQLSNKLFSLESQDAEIAKLKQAHEHLEKEVLLLAEKISSNRKKTIPSLEEKLNKLLKRVGMIHAAVKVDIHPSALDSSGIDHVEFLFQANLVPGSTGASYQPLARVASGGELSRLMLCIKSLVAKVMELPTLVFDEIDTGISGEAALQVGNIMRELSASRQVIAITHQPQLASRATTHYYVQKEKQGGVIRTAVRKLDRSGRVEAIARMLSGDKPSASAIANAEEMVSAQ